jgi:hypothetical protein
LQRSWISYLRKLRWSMADYQKLTSEC